MTTEKKETASESDMLWNKIKDLDLELFSLPDQTLEKYATRFPVTESEVHLKIKVAAVLPALESALRQVKLPKDKMFDVSQQKEYTIISVIDK